MISYGVAFDIGTTTVVGRLWDLNNSKFTGDISATNPQSDFGADVISRIMYCNEKEGNLTRLQWMIIDCLNQIIKEFKREYGIPASDIEKVVCVGNTTMSHLLLGVDPSSLAVAPFSPGFTGAVNISAGKLGIMGSSDALVKVPPNIAGHVGSDALAAMLSTEIARMKGNNLVIDIGTNGEILLAAEGEITSCSAAAGPAFEGARIKHGMRGVAGAIEGVKIADGTGEVLLKVIGNKTPLGICGSGLVDSISELLKHGIVTKEGKMISSEEALQMKLPKSLAERIVTAERGSYFILQDDESYGEIIYITQKDVREIQYAKGAISAGIRVMLEDANLKADDLDGIYLAGAFGNNIDKKSAVMMGLLPNIGLDKIHAAGNAAGDGASMALLSDELFNEAIELSQNIKHIELADHHDFQKIFLASLNFSW